MKKLKLVFFAILVFGGSNLIAQKKWDFGLQMAHSYGSYNYIGNFTENGVSSGLRSAHETRFGILARRKNLGKRFELDLEGGYILGWHNDSQDRTNRMHSTYFNVKPKLKLSPKWYLSTGLETKFLMNKEASSFQQDASRLEIIASLGLEYKLNDKVNFFTNFKKILNDRKRVYFEPNFEDRAYLDYGFEIGATFLLNRE